MPSKQEQKEGVTKQQWHIQRSYIYIYIHASLPLVRHYLVYDHNIAIQVLSLYCCCFSTCLVYV
jgi:hypothetical protein